MKKSYNFTLNQSMDQELDHYAKSHDMTRSAVLEAALKEFFLSTKNAQNSNIDNLHKEVDDLTQRMEVLEEKFASLTPTTIITEAHHPPIEPEPIISMNEDHIFNSDPPLNPEKWYRQKDVVEMLPESININTLKQRSRKRSQMVK